jgi:hypothetical protein
MARINKEIFKFLIKNEKNKALHWLLSRYSNNGLIEEEASEEDYIFGADNGIAKEILRPDGQWLDYLPEEETQKLDKTDPMACVSFSLNNCIEILLNRKYGIKRNDSDRFLAKVSNTTARGNTQRQVIDARRHFGIVSEDKHPTFRGFSWTEYYSEISSQLMDEAKKDLTLYDINYEFVFNDSPKVLMEALKYSPVWIAGYAWLKKGDFYYSYGNPNHAFDLVGYKENRYWIAFDSYSPHVKLLDWNFNFAYPKTIYINAKDAKRQERETLISKGIKYIMRTDALNGGRGQVYEIKPEGLKELNQTDKMKPEELKKFMNNWVTEQLNKKILTGITEEKYKSLI